MNWPPHPPANPSWPKHVQRFYAEGCKRIDRLRTENILEDGTTKVPFRCYGCDKVRSDYAMTTGDGLPPYSACLGGLPDES